MRKPRWPAPAVGLGCGDRGWVAERLKAAVLKTAVRASVPWVRIPPHPPFQRLCDSEAAGAAAPMPLSVFDHRFRARGWWRGPTRITGQRSFPSEYRPKGLIPACRNFDSLSRLSAPKYLFDLARGRPTNPARIWRAAAPPTPRAIPMSQEVHRYQSPPGKPGSPSSFKNVLCFVVAVRICASIMTNCSCVADKSISSSPMAVLM